MEKVTFKLNLKGIIDFARQINCIVILAKFFYHKHVAKYFTLHLLFICSMYLLS